jgi:hypothetical protein
MANENTLADLRQTFPAAKELEDEDLLELWQRHNNSIAAGEESDFGRLLDAELAAEDEDDFEGEDDLSEDEDGDPTAAEPETPADDLIDDAPGEERSGSEPDKAA